MKKRGKEWLFLAVTVFLIYGVLLEFRRGSQYHVGMSIAEVRAQTGNRYEIRGLAVDYDPTPTPEQKNEQEIYYVCDEAEGVVLFFNHYDVIVAIKRKKVFGVDIAKVVQVVRDLGW